jgi:hypothetical protein
VYPEWGTVSQDNALVMGWKPPPVEKKAIDIVDGVGRKASKLGESAV